MYYQHFGLSGAPFQTNPSPKLLFMSKAHRMGRIALEWSLEHEPSGFSLLIGATGTGKTSLIISLLSPGHALVRIAYVSNPKLGFDGLLQNVARQLGVKAHTDRLEMFYAFDRYLDALAPRERVVVIVDEAQGLSDETLDDLRLFSNRELQCERRLHFVLAGQPGLLSRLSTPALRQINERVGARILLNPLEEAEGRAYVDYRLAAFGASADGVFTRGSLEYLLARCDGIPRRINLYCHNAMLRGCQAGESRVSLESARSAALDLEGASGDAHRYHPVRAAQGFMHSLVSMRQGLAPALIAATLAIAGIGSLYWWNSGSSRTDDPIGTDASTASDADTETLGTNHVAIADPVSGPSTVHAAAAADEDHQLSRRRVRVRSGDTLVTIARAHLGSEDGVTQLIEANPQIGNINHIYPGEILYLPPSNAARSNGSPATRETAASDLRPVPDVAGFNGE